jgi:hypothetical protein
MSVVGSTIRTDRGTKDIVAGQLGYLPADGYTKDTSTPSVIFVGDGIVQDSIGYKLSDILPSVTSVTFNRELIGTLLFLPA